MEVPILHKTCTKCDEEKPATLEFFRKQKDGKFGLRADCKICQKEYDKNYYADPENKARKNEYVERYRESHKEEISQCVHDYYELHREQILEYAKAYRESHEEEVSATQKAWYSRPENKKSHNLRQYNRYINDVQHRLSCNMRTRLRRSIKQNWQSGKTIDEIGCSIESLKKHIESQFQPDMMWDNWGRGGWELDHIRPLSSFDLTKPGQLLEATHWTNIQPLWANQNRSKGGRYCEKQQDYKNVGEQWL